MMAATEDAQTDRSDLLLDIAPGRQQLFGFMLESVEGLATHSRDKDSSQLKILLPDGQTADFEIFLACWERFVSHH